MAMAIKSVKGNTANSSAKSSQQHGIKQTQTNQLEVVYKISVKPSATANELKTFSKSFPHVAVGNTVELSPFFNPSFVRDLVPDILDSNRFPKKSVVLENFEVIVIKANPADESDKQTVIKHWQWQAHQSGNDTETQATPPPSEITQVPICHETLRRSLRQSISDKRISNQISYKSFCRNIDNANQAYLGINSIYGKQFLMSGIVHDLVNDNKGDNSAILKVATCGNLNKLLTLYRHYDEFIRQVHVLMIADAHEKIGHARILYFLTTNADLMIFFASENVSCLTRLDTFENEYLPQNKRNECEQYKRMFIFEKLICQRFDAIQTGLEQSQRNNPEQITDNFKYVLHMLRLRYYFFITKNITSNGEYKNSLMRLHRDKFNPGHIKESLEEFCTVCAQNNDQEDLNHTLFKLCSNLIKMCRDHPDSDGDFYDIVFFIFNHRGLQELLTTESNFKQCSDTVALWLDKTVKSLETQEVLFVSDMIIQLNKCVGCPLLKKIKAEAESVCECKGEESELASGDVIGCFEKIDKMNTDLQSKKQELDQWLSESEVLENSQSEPLRKAQFKITRYALSESASVSSSEGDGLLSGINSKAEDTVKPAAHIETDDFETLNSRISRLFNENRSSLETSLTALDNLLSAESKEGKTLDDKCTGLIRLAKVDVIWFHVKVQLFEILKYVSNIQQYKFALANGGFHDTYKFKDRFITSVKKIPGLCDNLNEIYNKLQRSINDFKQVTANSDVKILFDNFSITFWGIKGLLTRLSKVHSLPREIKRLCLMRRAALAEQYINKKTQQEQGLTSEEIDTGKDKSSEMLETINQLTTSFGEFEAAVKHSE